MAWLGTWTYRKAIKYGATKPVSDLTDFSLLISIVSDADIGAALSSRKFAVTTADGTTTVPYGAISYSESSGQVTANIRAKFSPSASASTGDVLGYLYYDDSQTDTENKSGVLDGYTQLYAPLEDIPTGSAGDIADWSGNYNGTSTSSPTSTTGAVSNGLSFSGSNRVRFPASSVFVGASSITLSAWMYSTGTSDLVAVWRNADIEPGRFQIQLHLGTL